jgi:hypothetical protein
LCRLLAGPEAGQHPLDHLETLAQLETRIEPAVAERRVCTVAIGAEVAVRKRLLCGTATLRALRDGLTGHCDPRA